MSHKRKQAVRDAGEELLPRRAFTVSGAPDFSQAEPQTAEEYLRRVKWEAKRQPRVLISSIDPRSFDHRQTRGYVRSIDLLPAASPLVLPSPQWETSFASQFADIRLELLRYTARAQGRTAKRTAEQAEGQSTPPPRAFPQWMQYCLGADLDLQHCIQGTGRQRQTSAPVTDEEEREHEEKELEVSSSSSSSSSSSVGGCACVEQQMRPTLRVVASWDQATTRGLLSRLIDHLQRCLAAVTSAASSASSLSAPAASFLCLPSPAHTVWLYCALLHLEKPLLPETDSELLLLYKVCGRIRHQAGQVLEQTQLQSRTQGESDIKAADEPAARSASDCAMYCNLLMTIVDKIFGQRVAAIQTEL